MRRKSLKTYNFVTTEEFEQKIKEGELFKVGKGIYSEKKYVPEIAVFVYKYPNAVVTMKSAFFFHKLWENGYKFVAVNYISVLVNRKKAVGVAVKSKTGVTFVANNKIL